VLLLFKVLLYKVNCVMIYMFKIRNAYKGLLVLKSMKIKTITYERYNKIISKLNKAKQQGLILDIRKNKFKVVLGCLCLGIAIIPNGLGIVFYPLSFYFLGFSLMDLENIKRKIKNKIRGFGLRA